MVPKGILLEKFNLLKNINKIPAIEPVIDPNKRVIQQPLTPAKAPIIDISSTSPCPRPSFFVKNLKVLLITNKKRNPNMLPVKVSSKVRGKK